MNLSEQSDQSLRLELKRREREREKTTWRECAGCGKPIRQGWEEIPGFDPPWRHVGTNSKYCSSARAEPTAIKSIPK